ncbi:ABC transporter ATP-binding protein [Paenibacillus alvei]|uniref:ABC transporter ATP-binding protein n=1 Tax=Paenibacillus TaxID=44249 RepID=UPI00028A2714|nr:ABC transporter ATP-binding protein [Paenibacillus alvei]EJW16827.1 putative ABC transporter ATP-binding protein YvrA [Paenibacillus alvei DSM 29]MCY7485880.1 ABC transporter ATP-binding protein [Paenibacillus alvei]MCY9540823.1 ABC transporter ATP-binding protein [Paenibacillus alvei]MCY9705156.1 ABC transporter ATP-binding protein [Paenibacillus alvei]MCY9733797.1 ABC transporter ATP-binding protein [Paenibacillus alvei]
MTQRGKHLPLRDLGLAESSNPANELVKDTIIEVQGLSKHYGEKHVLHDVELRVQAGEWVGIIGPNGSGKSTLLSLLSGADRPTSGSIQVNGQALASYKRRALSQLMAVLQQEALPPLGFTVREVVEMGRFPFQSWLGSESEDSGALVDRIMERLQLTELADYPLDRISGGQRQRTALAKLMVQSPSIVLLDEPTTYLDIHYQVQFMDIVRDWQKDCGLTIVSVLHDLNLASLYCDRLVVIHDGGIAAQGTPDELMNPELLSRIFATDTTIVPHPDTGRPQVLIRPSHG